VRVFVALEHLPQRAGYGWPGLADSTRELGRAPTVEGARALIDARLATHPEERGHFTIAVVWVPDGQPLPPPGEGGTPGT
jgi:hypothetical protein